MSDVYQALADPTRRQLLDALRKRNRQTLTELVVDLPISRQAVAKHLSILIDANLVVVQWHGREKLHYLNPVPLAEIVQRWIGRFEDARLQMLNDLKLDSERREKRRA